MKQKELFKSITFGESIDFKKLFLLKSLILGSVDFNGAIIVGMISYKDATALASSWKEINSYLAANFISTLENEYSKWNFYLFYLVEGPVEKTLKYEIENNKFSSRKIVCEKVTAEITPEFITHTISEHITNDNIRIIEEAVPAELFVKDPMLSELFGDLTKPKTNAADQEKALVAILDQLERKLSDEI